MSSWRYGTIKHTHRGSEHYEVYYTVHEFFFNDDGLPWGFTNNPVSPQSKKEAEKMGKAFDKEPLAVAFDDTSVWNVEEGYLDYEYEWLVPHGDM